MVRSAETLRPAAEILTVAIAEERADKKFKTDQIRVSSIGSCARKVLGEALGYFVSDFPFEFSEGGNLLEGAATARVIRKFPLSEAQVVVPTSAPRTNTHPDLLLIPDGGIIHGSRPTRSQDGLWTDQLLVGHGVQMKSNKRRNILEYRAAMESGAERSERDLKFGLPKAEQVDQALLEWYFWRRAGYCKTQWFPHGEGPAQRIIEGIPETYELLYYAREDFGDTRVSIPVEWDEERAQALADEFARRVELLKWGELPEPAHPMKYWDNGKPHFECAWQPKWYDWDGPHAEAPKVCPMFASCHGREFDLSMLQTTRKPRRA